MSAKNNGRFCGNCKKVIVDFSHLSDQELYRFFENNPTTTCGRFHNDQLDKNILPSRHNTFTFKNIYRTAAAVFALLTLRYTGSASTKKETITTLHPSSTKNPASCSPGKITINGNVADEHGHKMENVKIKFGDSLIAATDVNGDFQFEIQDPEPKPYTLLFSYPGFTMAVRNYHPAMLSTSYSITLYRPDSMEYGFTMGIRRVNTENFPEMTIDFNKSESITTEVKASLTELATALRNHPEYCVAINGYPRKNDSRTVSLKKLNKIKAYLTDIEGIGEERFVLTVEKYSAEKQNTVEIKHCPEIED